MLGPEIDVAALEERIFLLKTQDNAVSWSKLAVVIQ